MSPDFCPEHTEVVRCLGSLETGQKNMAEQTQRIELKIDSGHAKVMAKIDEMKNSEQKKSLSDAIQGAKVKILFWVIAISFVALVSGMSTALFKALGWK